MKPPAELLREAEEARKVYQDAQAESALSQAAAEETAVQAEVTALCSRAQQLTRSHVLQEYRGDASRGRSYGSGWITLHEVEDTPGMAIQASFEKNFGLGATRGLDAVEIYQDTRFFVRIYDGVTLQTTKEACIGKVDRNAAWVLHEETVFIPIDPTNPEQWGVLDEVIAAFEANPPTPTF